MENGFVVLETGECFKGRWRGGKSRVGEVVFNTSHSGYEEIATDPSYFQQIMVMSAPMMGNYGVSDDFWESHKYWIQGFVALQIQSTQRDRHWVDRLNEFDIPVIDEVNTREIVLRLREGGTVWGGLVKAATAEEALEWTRAEISKTKDQLDSDWAHQVSVKEPEVLAGENSQGHKVVLVDYGCKTNIKRELRQRCREVVVVPSRASADEIMQHSPDGVFLSNGPGDPENVEVAVQSISEIVGRVPIMGICMGHQLLARALGAKTFSLKFGHRGSNHPIKDSILERIYITSQNHGYAVDAESLPSDIEVTHTNLNDGTVAGLRHRPKRCFSVQFHPECHPGPRDALGLFDTFANMMSE